MGNGDYKKTKDTGGYSGPDISGEGTTVRDQRSTTSVSRERRGKEPKKSARGRGSGNTPKNTRLHTEG